MSNVECWHFDAHVNTCIVTKMKSSQDRFRAIWNYVIMRFQNHVKNQFLFHKRSIKLSKKKKYKNPLSNSQTVNKFIIPKESEKEYFRTQKAKFDERKRQDAAKNTPKDVNIGDIISGKNQAQAAEQSGETEELKELNLPNGKTTAKAKASSAGIRLTAGAAAAESAPISGMPAMPAEKPSKPLVVEMKERPGVEADYDSDPTLVKLVFTVMLENSAKNIELDVAEKELKLESEK